MKKTIALIIVMAALALIAWFLFFKQPAHVPPPAPTPQDASTGAIEVRLIGADGKGVENAEVVMRPDTAFGAITLTPHAKGVYTAEGLAAEAWSVIVEADGYSSTQRRIKIKAGETTRLRIGLTPFVSKTAPTQSISVTLSAVCAGKPVSAEFSVFTPHTAARESAGSGESVSVALESGEYVFEARAQGYKTGTLKKTLDGKTASLSFVIELAPSPVLKGRVVSARDGSPIKNATVVIFEQDKAPDLEGEAKNHHHGAGEY